jgi:hypothetical protein
MARVKLAAFDWLNNAGVWALPAFTSGGGMANVTYTLVGYRALSSKV